MSAAPWKQCRRCTQPSWKPGAAGPLPKLTKWSPFAPKGRIDLATVDNEISRLGRLWSGNTANREDGLAASLDAERLYEIDPFDRVQLTYVASICRESSSLSEAGRHLFFRLSLRNETRISTYPSMTDRCFQLKSSHYHGAARRLRIYSSCAVKPRLLTDERAAPTPLPWCDLQFICNAGVVPDKALNSQARQIPMSPPTAFPH